MEKKSEVLIKVEGLKKYFPLKSGKLLGEKRVLKAVDDVGLEIPEGKTVGLVGESGCGKSTLGRTILKLHSVTGGRIYYKGEDIALYTEYQMRNYRKNMQIIFQDPYASLDPRKTIFESVKAPLDVFRIGTEAEREQKVREMLEYVGMGEYQVGKLPHELSGGQRQRVVIARAMISEPGFIVCDEPVSALDVSVRSQVLNLMKDAQRKTNVAYLFISHDLSVVRYLCDQVAVMYLGSVVEYAKKEELFENPQHPYTQALLSAIPIPDVDVKKHRIVLEGDVPSPINPPSGCHFHTRCPYATEECAREEVSLRNIGKGHQVACLRVAGMSAGA